MRSFRKAEKEGKSSPVALKWVRSKEGGHARRTAAKKPSALFPRAKAPKGPSGPGKLGTFLGVFTPTILTILGVIMYLRFGWVVGQVGLGRTLLIVALANAISLVTALALSAVATNTRVGVGGAYYIISRSLGLEIGGIESNTVILGWPDEPKRMVHFLRAIRRLARLNQSLLIGRIRPLAPSREGVRRTIHIWWGGLQRNGGLVLLGLAVPEKGEEETYSRRLNELAEGLPSCFFVHNGSLFIGELLTPDDGEEQGGNPA
nr:hypothetical protein [Desulfuromonas sp.]